MKLSVVKQRHTFGVQRRLTGYDTPNSVKQIGSRCVPRVNPFRESASKQLSNFSAFSRLFRNTNLRINGQDKKKKNYIFLLGQEGETGISV